jgi:hypothetical protein
MRYSFILQVCYDRNNQRGNSARAIADAQFAAPASGGIEIVSAAGGLIVVLCGADRELAVFRF